MATTIITADQGFDQTYYLQAKAAQLTAATGTTWTVAQTLAAITAAGLTPAQHYSLYGYNEGLTPNAYFNTDQYAASKAAAVGGGYTAAQFQIDWYNASGSSNLYLHYLMYGAFENNVSPSTGFDDYSYYVAKAAQMGNGATWQDARAAIQAAGLNAISHYLLYGVSESLSYTPTASSVPGQTFTLTTNTDNILGTTGNDTIIGDWTLGSVNASDQINGNAGVDTLKIYGALGTLPASVTNVEIIDLVNPGTSKITDTTLGLPTGVTKLQIEQASTTTAGTITTTSHSGLTLELATLNGAVAQNITWAASTSDTSLNLELSGFQKAGGTGDLTVTGGTGLVTMNVTSDTAANGISTFTLPTTVTAINVNAATALTIGAGLAGDGLVSTKAKTLTISGAGRVTINGPATDLANTLTVDATNNSGGVLYTDEVIGSSTLTFKGGSGNDTVTFAAGKLTTADTLTGGAGTDTIAVNDTALNVGANLAAVNAATSFEVLGLNTANATLDISLLTNGINSVAVGSAAGANNVTTSNSLSTTTYTIDNSAGNGTLAIGNALSQYTTSVTINSGTTAGTSTLGRLTIGGATTVNLTSSGTGVGAVNAITAFNNVDGSTINLAGSAGLTLTLAGTATGSKLDGTNFTGALKATGSGFGDVIIGGSAADTLNGAAGKDTISGGAGADTLIVNNALQADILTGGAGADTFQFSGTSAGVFTTSDGTADIVHITDFVAGTDKIKLTNTTTAFTGATLTTQTVATATTLQDVWNGLSSVALSTKNASCVLVTVSAGAAAGTYLYVNDTASTAVETGADLLINLTGITGTLSTSDITF